MLTFLALVTQSGCMVSQLRNQMTAQAASIPNVYYQEVLNNLAMIQADPSRMPYFSDPQTARNQIQQNSSTAYGANLDLITTGPVTALSLFNRYLFDRHRLTLTGVQSRSGEWSAVTANDPDKLFLMRAAYRSVTGTATEEDKKLLDDFYYRHFEITDEGLEAMRRERPQVYERIGDRLARLKGIEYLSVDSFESRLREKDVLGRDDLDRYRRAILHYARLRNEPLEFVSDADTRHLLYATSLHPGWFGVSPWTEVPRQAAYTGRYDKTCVYVTPENTEALTRLTLAILDIHTFRSERLGGSRVQPGLLPR